MITLFTNLLVRLTVTQFVNRSAFGEVNRQGNSGTLVTHSVKLPGFLCSFVV